MKYVFNCIQNTSRLVPMSRAGLSGRIAGLGLCLFGLTANAAEITVDGLGDVVKGDVRAKVLVDEPVKQVQMTIAGVVNRIEKSAPYALMSDHNGELNPWDTTAHANGEYLLTVIATLESGEEVTEHFSFEIGNAYVKPQTDQISVGITKLPSQVYAGQQFTIPTSGLADGEVVWLHLFDKSWGNLIRKNLEVSNDQVTVTIPEVTGLRRLQLQYKSDFKQTRLVEVLSAIELPEPAPAAVPEPEAAPEPLPEPSPESEQAPVAEQTPESEPETVTEAVDPAPVADDSALDPVDEQPSISMASIPAELTVGQRITLEVTGIDDGESVFYHMFDRQWSSDVVRSNVVVTDGKLELLIPDVTGDRILQLQYKNTFKGNKNISVLAEVTPPVVEVIETVDVPDVPDVPDTAPESEPAADAVTATPEPEVAPEPVQTSIEMASIPASLTVGQRISVAVTGIDEGELIYYHLFDKQWGDLVRTNVAVQDGEVELVVPAVSGDRILQLQYKNVYKASKGVNVASATNASNDGNADATLPATDVSVQPEIPATETPDVDTNEGAVDEPIEVPAPAVDTTEPAEESAGDTPDTTPTTPSAVPTLEAGSGWKSETNQPNNVGNDTHPGYDLTAISRWAVVPHQVFSGDFTIGVAAFHAYGIDRVEFSVDNGPWVSVTEMSTNPRTQAQDYYVNLDAERYGDGKVVVRAIAYPTVGKPRVLQDLELFANSGGSLSFPVLELGAGTHHLSNLSNLTPKEEGWLTVRPKAGVAKEDCIITGVDRVGSGGHLKIQGVTMQAPGGNQFLYGKATGDGQVWLDDVKVIGNGRSNATSWLVHLWGKQFYTDCEITKVRNVFHGGGGELFARNVKIYDTYEDVFRSFGYVANVTIDGVDRGDTDWHPDLFEFAETWTQYQAIFHNVVAREAYAQGAFGGNLLDVAIVDCDIETPGWNAMQLKAMLKNVVFENTRLQGGARFRDAEPDGVMIRDSSIGWQPPYLPEGWEQAGVTVLPLPPLYD